MPEIDKSAFSVNEREGEYEISFAVRGTVRMKIKAASEEDARAKAEGMIEDETIGEELDDVSDIRLVYVSKTPRMFRVLREGCAMQVSRLEEGDLPREPDERGF